jgi:hypothetical protein
MLRRSLTALAVVALAAPAALAPAFGQETMRVRGTVVKVEGPLLVVKSRDGAELRIKVAGDKPVYTALVKASAGDIKPNSYIGVTSLPQPDGSLKAVAVHLFPEAARGAAEGHRAWDLMPQSMMTNATVETTVAGVSGEVVTVKYKDGAQKVLLTPQTSIVRMVPGEAADVMAGTHILIFAAQKQADGSWATQRVTYGKDGLTPPM